MPMVSTVALIYRVVSALIVRVASFSRRIDSLVPNSCPILIALFRVCM